MKDRPNGFLSEDNIDHFDEIFDYIKELHEYLWKFVYIANPGASGKLDDFVDDAIVSLSSARSEGYVQALDDFHRELLCTTMMNGRYHIGTIEGIIDQLKSAHGGEK
jgi:hypothetical protein